MPTESSAFRYAGHESASALVGKICSTSGLAVLLAAVAPSSAIAQEVAPTALPNAPHWGVTGSFTPAWRIPKVIADIITRGEETVDIDGREFSIGLARGRITGGDWGLSFVRKNFQKGSTSVEETQTCVYPAGTPCFPAKTTEKYDDASFPGVEFHWFIPVATVRQRVQIGLNLAAGAARPSGTVTRITDDVRLSPTNPVTATPIHSEETPDMSDDWGPALPILKGEAQAAVLLGPAFKVKVGGGLNFPGAGFNISAAYLFGPAR